MRVLEPKENHTYLYFYNDDDLTISQDMAAVKKYLWEIGCKIGAEVRVKNGNAVRVKDYL